jgi:8-oxo-dGTP pyrophosphatase MutT (NUDIX family)
MDVRPLLLELLARHCPEGDKEAADLARMREYARTLADPVSPDELGAHFTASAIVVDPPAEHVCFVYHKKLGRWLQPGGHVDRADQGSLVRAALREVREETGLEVKLHAVAPAPLDVDIHAIPARGAAAEHEHLDVRFLTVAATTAIAFDPDESLGVRWFTWEEALQSGCDAALARLLGKAERACRADQR